MDYPLSFPMACFTWASAMASGSTATDSGMSNPAAARRSHKAGDQPGDGVLQKYQWLVGSKWLVVNRLFWLIYRSIDWSKSIYRSIHLSLVHLPLSAGRWRCKCGGMLWRYVCGYGGRDAGMWLHIPNALPGQLSIFSVSRFVTLVIPKSIKVCSIISSRKNPWCGCFHTWEYPTWMVYKGKSIYKWMIWGYSYCRNPPCLFPHPRPLKTAHQACHLMVPRHLLADRLCHVSTHLCGLHRLRQGHVDVQALAVP